MFKFFSSRLFSPEAPRTKAEAYAEQTGAIPMAMVKTKPRHHRNMLAEEISEGTPSMGSTLHAPVHLAPSMRDDAPVTRRLPLPGQASARFIVSSIRPTSRVSDQWLGPWSDRSHRSVVAVAAPSRRTVRLPTSQGATRMPLQHWYLLPEAKIVTDLAHAGYVDRRHAVRCADFPGMGREKWVELADGLRPLRGWLKPDQWQAVGIYLAQQPRQELQQAIVQVENIVHLHGPGAPGLPHMLYTLAPIPQRMRAKFVALVAVTIGLGKTPDLEAQALLATMARTEAWHGHPAMGAGLLVEARIGAVVLGIAMAECKTTFDRRAAREACLAMMLDEISQTSLELSAGDVSDMCEQWMKWPEAERAQTLRQLLREMAINTAQASYPKWWDHQLGGTPGYIARVFSTQVARDISVSDELDASSDADARKLISRLPLFGMLPVNLLLTQLGEYLRLPTGWKNPAADEKVGETTRRTAALLALQAIQYTGAAPVRRIAFAELHTTSTPVSLLALPTLLALVCREGAKKKDGHTRDLIAHSLGMALARCVEAPGMPGVLPLPICGMAMRQHITSVLYGYGLKLPGELTVHEPRSRELATALAVEFQHRWGNRSPTQAEAFEAYVEGGKAGRGMWFGITERERKNIEGFTFWFRRTFDALEWPRPDYNPEQER